MDADEAEALDAIEAKALEIAQAESREAADAHELGLPWQSRMAIERGFRTLSQRGAWHRMLEKVRHSAVSNCTLTPPLIRLLPLQYSTERDPLKGLWGRIFEEEQSWRILLTAPSGWEKMHLFVVVPPLTSIPSFRHKTPTGTYILGTHYIVLPRRMQNSLRRHVDATCGAKYGEDKLTDFVRTRCKDAWDSDMVRRAPGMQVRAAWTNMYFALQYRLKSKRDTPLAQLCWRNTALSVHVIDAEAPFDGTKAEQDAFVAKWELVVAEAMKHLKKNPKRAGFMELKELCEHQRR